MFLFGADIVKCETVLLYCEKNKERYSKTHDAAIFAAILAFVA